MVDEKQQASGQEVSDEKKQIDEKKEDVVKYETYSRTLGEAKKAKDEVKSLKAEIAAFKAEKEAEEKTKLEEQGKFKELNEDLKQQLLNSQKEKNNLLEKIEKAKKLTEFEKMLPGKLLNKDFLTFVDLKAIEMEDANKVENTSLKVEVDRFVAKYPELLDMGSSDIPGNQPASSKSTKTIAYQEWLKLTLSEKAKWKKSQIIGD